MAGIDDILERAAKMRAAYRDLRALFDEGARQRAEGEALAAIGKNLIGKHLDNLADSRDRVRAARITQVREYLIGPRPERQIITDEEFARQKEIARELLNCTDPHKALELCNQALQESIGLIERHDTMDVLADVEPLMAIAHDAHEQVIAWYEAEDMRITFAEYKQRQAEGKPSLAAEYVAGHPVSIEGAEIARHDAAGKLVVPAASVATPTATPTIGEVASDTPSNPTADPT